VEREIALNERELDRFGLDVLGDVALHRLGQA
jgi:hypothetical protein